MHFSKKIFIGLMVFVSSLGLFADEWYVCAGSFKNQDNSKNRCQVLEEKGFKTFEGVVTSSENKTLYRVFIDKPFTSERLAVAYKNELNRNPQVSNVDKANLWCVKYSGPKNRYIFVGTGKEIVKEVIKEVPVEKIVEVIKEVPVEKTVEVIKEVPVEKTVEVIKEVPVEKIVEVIKEVPVEKTVEVIKEVPVEKTVEVIKEVPVEKIVEVIKEVPVEAPAAEEPAPAAEEPASAVEESAPAAEEQEKILVTSAPVAEAPVEDMNFSVDGRKILIKDSDTGVPVAGASVSIDDGKFVVEADENGFVVIPDKVKNGDHTLLITKDDSYVPTTQVLTIAKKKVASANQISIPRKVEYERYKIVLDWGLYPQDLDANVIYKNQRIYYKNNGIEGIRLDRDDKDSYGPETITIENIDSSNTYCYYVTDYTDEGNDYCNYLSKSNATVTVYKNNDYYKSFSFDRPTNGVTWHVFDIVNNEIVEVNSISNDNLNSIAGNISSEAK